MKGFMGFTNRACEFFPCHSGIEPDQFNCLYCYCPLIDKECPGPYKTIQGKYREEIKDCSGCTLPHNGFLKSWKFIQRWAATAPIWCGGKQSQQRIGLFSSVVRQRFDASDIQWATLETDKR